MLRQTEPWRLLAASQQTRFMIGQILVDFGARQFRYLLRRQMHHAVKEPQRAWQKMAGQSKLAWFTGNAFYDGYLTTLISVSLLLLSSKWTQDFGIFQTEREVLFDFHSCAVSRESAIWTVWKSQCSPELGSALGMVLNGTSGNTWLSVSMLFLRKCGLPADLLQIWVSKRAKEPTKKRSWRKQRQFQEAFNFCWKLLCFDMGHTL